MCFVFYRSPKAVLSQCWPPVLDQKPKIGNLSSLLKTCVRSGSRYELGQLKGSHKPSSFLYMCITPICSIVEGLGSFWKEGWILKGRWILTADPDGWSRSGFLAIDGFELDLARLRFGD